MGFENVCDGDPSFAGHIDVNVHIGARIEDRCHAFIIIANQIRKLGDTLGLNGFKNERHCSDLTRSDKVAQASGLRVKRIHASETHALLHLHGDRQQMIDHVGAAIGIAMRWLRSA